MTRESMAYREWSCRGCYRGWCRGISCALAGIVVFIMFVERGQAQDGGYDRSFAESKSAVEKALKDMPFSLAGRLPVLDGFALPGDRPLDRYQRGYFQSTVQVSTTASGGSVVHVSTKVTAWYPDPIPSRSGYQLLTSNGRLEADLLDELAEELGKRAAAGPPATPTPTTPTPTTPPPTTTTPAMAAPTTTAPTAAPTTATNSPVAAASIPPTPSPSIAAKPPSSPRPIVQTPPADSAPSAPTPRLPETGGTFSSSVAQGLASRTSDAPAAPAPVATGDPAGLKAEAESLEEILKNQAHPKNLVAVKKSGTPVVDAPSLKAKTLFLASEHDEFEMLDFNADWVHVRISGLSRGWVWRTSLEMPDEIPAVDAKPGAAPAAADLFHVVREETSTFPGDWGPLRGKSVKILSVEKIDENAKNSTTQEKLEFAKSLLEQRYADLARNSGSVEGIVLIFDSADGGMIAVTLPVLQQWKAGTLSDAACGTRVFSTRRKRSAPPRALPPVSRRGGAHTSLESIAPGRHLLRHANLKRNQPRRSHRPSRPHPRNPECPVARLAEHLGAPQRGTQQPGERYLERVRRCGPSDRRRAY
jgi:hypothetical protein